MPTGSDNIAFFRGGKPVSYKQRMEELNNIRQKRYAKASTSSLPMKPLPKPNGPILGKFFDDVVEETDRVVRQNKLIAEDEQKRMDFLTKGRKEHERKFPKTRAGLINLLKDDDSELPL